MGVFIVPAVGHIINVAVGDIEVIDDDRQIIHSGTFAVDGELIIEGELCLIS